MTTFSTTATAVDTPMKPKIVVQRKVVLVVLVVLVVQVVVKNNQGSWCIIINDN